VEEKKKDNRVERMLVKYPLKYFVAAVDLASDRFDDEKDTSKKYGIQLKKLQGTLTLALQKVLLIQEAGSERITYQQVEKLINQSEWIAGLINMYKNRENN